MVPLTRYTNGLILVTGSVGSGKSTTLASIVDFINQDRHDHIITLEDPIEYIIPPKIATSTSVKCTNTRNPSHGLCAARSVKTRTSSWWVKCAT